MKPVALIFLSIAAALAADKDNTRFAPGPASSYKGAQTLDKITIAAVPFVTEEQVKSAFGKVNPNKYGVLPVLVVIENGTGKALRLDLMTEYIDAEKQHVPALSIEDVKNTNFAPKAPRMPGMNPLPFPLPSRGKKGPLNVWEIEGRAFAAKLLPPSESASGFFYFYSDHTPGSQLYLTGIKEAATGKDYFYFEVPVEKQ